MADARRLIFDNPRRTISFSSDDVNDHFITIQFWPANGESQTFFITKTNVFQLALQSVTPPYIPGRTFFY